ncbi:Acetyltransferase (GNAT) family [Yersinia enterocolitica]|nr:Acetyltransferase (GNAT) family [Yersinia enterocolitica]
MVFNGVQCGDYWLCALYIEENFRGHAYGELLIKHLAKEAKSIGFDELHLCTDHIGFYEKYGFTFTGMGYHPWGESSRIYSLSLI